MKSSEGTVEFNGNFLIEYLINFSLGNFGLVAYQRSWCNGYRRRKWTRRHEFKSETRLIAFHIALIHLGKV